MWTQWVNGILGLWVLISPFLGFSPDGMTTNLVIVGILVAILGFAGAVQERKYREDVHTHTHQHA